MKKISLSLSYKVSVLWSLLFAFSGLGRKVHTFTGYVLYSFGEDLKGVPGSEL